MTAEETLSVNQTCDICDDGEFTPGEDYYRSLFESAPVALYMVDYSGVKSFLDDLKTQGIEDFAAYFAEHSDALNKCYESIGEATVNKALLDLYKAKSLKQLCSQMYQTVMTDHSHRGFIELLVAFANGAMRFSNETIDRNLKGDPFRATVTWVVAAGYEQTWERVIVNLTPINANT